MDTPCPIVFVLISNCSTYICHCSLNSVINKICKSVIYRIRNHQCNLMVFLLGFYVSIVGLGYWGSSMHQMWEKAAWYLWQFWSSFISMIAIWRKITISNKNQNTQNSQFTWFTQSRAISTRENKSLYYLLGIKEKRELQDYNAVSLRKLISSRLLHLSFLHLFQKSFLT